MHSLVELVTFVWLLAWTALAVKAILAGQRHSILFIMVVFFVFCGLPLFFNAVVGEPSYEKQPGFYISSRDTPTVLLYCAYVAIIPPFWYMAGRGSVADSAASRTSLSRLLSVERPLLRPIFLVLMISPALALLFAPDPGDFLEYAGRTAARATEADTVTMSKVIGLLSLISIVSSAGFLVSSPGFSLPGVLFVVPFLFIACWLNGKRHSVALALVLLVYVLWQKRILRGIKLIVATCAAVAGLMVFSLFYQAHVRGVDLDAVDLLYNNFRIDLGRDDVIKLAIYAELNPGRVRILDYAGQSLWFNCVCFVPRGIYPDKPWPYAVYVTSAHLLHTRARPLGWTMTTSWLDEAIANFSWFGMVIGPALFPIICRLGDRSPSRLTQILTILVGSLFLVTQLIAFLPLFLLWIVSMFMARRPSPARALVVRRFREAF